MALANTAALTTIAATIATDVDTVVAALAAPPSGDTEGTISAVAAVTTSLAESASKLTAAVTPPAPLALGPATAASGTVGDPYSQALTVTGGVAPVTLSVSAGALPPGLSLDTANSAIDGTPTTSGSYNATITATDSSATPQTASVEYTWTL